MANTYKNIVITPNITTEANVVPTIRFSGGDATLNTDINLRVYTTQSGTLSFEGSAGQLFSITNDLTNTIFSVNDVSGIPSIEVDANGLIKFAEYNGNVAIGRSTAGYKLDVVGTINASSILVNGSPLTANLAPAFNQANAAYDRANTAFNHANAAYGQANTALSTGQAAFSQANTAYNQANTALSTGQAAFGQANTAYNQANAAYSRANSALANSTGLFNGTLTISNDLIVLGTVNAASNLIIERIVAASNGSVGVAGQVLTSNGMGDVYWATPSAGGGGGTGNVTIGNTFSNIFTSRSTQNTINFIPGDNVYINVDNDGSGGRANVRISANAPGGWWAPTTSVVTGTSVSAVKDTRYFLTNNSSTIVTLPSSPTQGDTIYVVVTNQLANNVIARNGNKIMSLNEDLTLDITYYSIGFTYIDTNLGWVII